MGGALLLVLLERAVAISQYEPMKPEGHEQTYGMGYLNAMFMHLPLFLHPSMRHELRNEEISCLHFGGLNLFVLLIIRNGQIGNPNTKKSWASKHKKESWKSEKKVFIRIFDPKS
jgi:hypothetical protein